MNKNTPVKKLPAPESKELLNLKQQSKYLIQQKNQFKKVSKQIMAELFVFQSLQKLWFLLLHLFITIWILALLDVARAQDCEDGDKFYESDNGSNCLVECQRITNEEHCYEAGAAYGLTNFDSTHSDQNYPLGCYRNQSSGGNYRLNTATSNSSISNNHQALCSCSCCYNVSIDPIAPVDSYWVFNSATYEPSRVAQAIYATTQSECESYCTSRGHTCNGLVSGNSLVSCVQACVMRYTDTPAINCYENCGLNQCTTGSYGGIEFDHCSGCEEGTIEAGEYACEEGCSIYNQPNECHTANMSFGTLQSWMTNASTHLTISPTLVSHFMGRPWPVEILYDDVYQRYSQKSYTVEINIDVNCSELVFAPLENQLFKINLRQNFDITKHFQYDADDPPRSWSEHCGYAEIVNIVLPEFCWEWEGDPPADLAQGYDRITCQPLTHSQYDGDDGVSHISAAQIDRDNSEHDVSESEELDFTVEVDCVYILWEPPADPEFPFYVAQTASFIPDRGAQFCPEELRWDQCGEAYLTYDLLPEWIFLNETDTNQLIMHPPFLVSATGDYVVVVTKRDPNQLMADMSTQLTLVVDVQCSDIPYQAVETQFQVDTLSTLTYSIPTDHILDDAGESWAEICGLASVTIKGAPEYCRLEKISSSEFHLICEPIYDTHIGKDTFTITQFQQEQTTQTLVTIKVALGDGQDISALLANRDPVWNIGQTLFSLNYKDEDSLNWLLTPSNYVADADLDDVLTVTVDLGVADVIFNFDGDFISIKQTSLEEFQDVINIFFQDKTTQITLIANDGIVASTQMLSFDFSDPVDDQAEELFVFEQAISLEEKATDFENIEESQIPRVTITDISTKGKVNINFSLPMEFPEDFADQVNEAQDVRRLQSEIIKVELLTQVDQQFGNVQFDWELNMLNSMELEIQLYFEEPVAISTAEEADSLEISFTDKSYFRTKGSNIPLQMTAIKQVVPPQVPLDDTVFDSMETAATSLKQAGIATGGVTAGMGFLLTASLSILYGLINMVQMYVHFPLLRLSLPGNLLSILSVFLEVAQLDLIGSEALFENVFGYKPVDGMEPFSDRFLFLKYETLSVIYNLGDVSVLQFWIFIKIGIFVVLSILATKVYCKCQEKHRELFIKKREQERHSINFNWPARFFLEVYLEYCIAALIKLKRQQYSLASGSDKFDTLLGVILLALVLVAPVFFMVYFTVNQDRLLNDKKFASRFETIFEGLRLNKLKNIWYAAFFMLRRLVFVIVVVFWSEVYTFQIQLAVINQMVFLVYIILYQPQKQKLDHNLEIFSEICILLFCYSCYAFGPVVPYPHARHKTGEFAISIFLINVTINLIFAVRALIQDIKRNINQNRDKIRAWLTAKGCKCLANMLKLKIQQRSVVHDVTKSMKYLLIQQAPYTELNLPFAMQQKVSSVNKVEFFGGQQVNDSQSSYGYEYYQEDNPKYNPFHWSESESEPEIEVQDEQTIRYNKLNEEFKQLQVEGQLELLDGANVPKQKTIIRKPDFQIINGIPIQHSQNKVPAKIVAKKVNTMQSQLEEIKAQKQKHEKKQVFNMAKVTAEKIKKDFDERQKQLFYNKQHQQAQIDVFIKKKNQELEKKYGIKPKGFHTLF